MLHKKNDCREWGKKRALSFRFLYVLLALVLLIPLPGAYAEVQNTSSTVQLGNSLQYGNTSYSVTCSFPSTVEVGTNLTIAVTLHVDSLTGLVEYISNYALVVELFVGEPGAGQGQHFVPGPPASALTRRRAPPRAIE